MNREQAKKKLEDEITCLSQPNCKDCPLDSEDGCQNDYFEDESKLYIEAYKIGLDAINKLEKLEELVNGWANEVEKYPCSEKYMGEIERVIYEKDN